MSRTSGLNMIQVWVASTVAKSHIPGSWVSSTATVPSLGPSKTRSAALARLKAFFGLRLRVPAITAYGSGGIGQPEGS